MSKKNKRWLWKVLFSAVLVISLWDCKGKINRRLASIGDEILLQSFPLEKNTNTIALVPLKERIAIILWSNSDGISGLAFDVQNRQLVGNFKVSEKPAKFISADLIKCGDKNYLTVISIPFVSLFEGNQKAKVFFIKIENLNFGLISKSFDLESAGPFSEGGAIKACSNCNVVVAWHTGEIGNFAVKVAGIDMENYAVLWTRDISNPDYNAFVPDVSCAGDYFVCVWPEKRRFTGEKKTSSRGEINRWIFDSSGGTLKSPASIISTDLPFFKPAVYFDGRWVNLLYKDRPVGEERDGIYFVRIDLNGNRTFHPVRVGRADGSENPVIMKLTGIGIESFATIVLRKLAGDQLIGLNIIDENGKKLQREIQIYSHGLKYRNVAAGYFDGKIMVLHSYCTYSGCKLVLTEVNLNKSGF